MNALVFPNFHGKAACQTIPNPDLMHPDQYGETRAAKKICADCPVKAECLKWALDNDERQGVWGGLSETDRARLKGRKPALPGRPLEPINHGRESGAASHRRRGEKACNACLTAERIARHKRGTA